MSVLSAMFGWLSEQLYVLANPFAGVKVRGGARTAVLDAAHRLHERGVEGACTLSPTASGGCADGRYRLRGSLPVLQKLWLQP